MDQQLIDECLVPECNSSSSMADGAVVFFLFPDHDREQIRCWNRALGFRANREHAPYAKVCSKHFRPDHMEQLDALVILKAGACPKLEDMGQHRCRLCALAQREKYEGSVDALRRSPELAFLLDFCLGPTVVHSSQLPDGVCGDCTGTLTHLMDFVRSCQAAQRQLRTMFEDNLSEYEIKSETEDQPADFVETGQRGKSPEDGDRSDISLKTDPEDSTSKKNWTRFGSLEDDELDGEDGDVEFECSNRQSCSDDDNAPPSLRVRTRCRTRKSERGQSEELCRAERKSKKIPRQSPSHSKQICQICGKVLSSSATLNVHMMTHTQQKDIVCHFCDRRFYVRQQLKIHIESIHEKKDFVCSVCGLKCRWRKSLRRHMLLHDDNPYKHKCTYCDKAFARPNQLRYHVMKHTGDRVYCNICGAEYRFNYMLTQHKIRKHGIVVEGVQLYKQSQRKKKEPSGSDAGTVSRVRVQRKQPLPVPPDPPPTIAAELHQVPELASPVTTVSCFGSPETQATNFPPAGNLTQLGYSEAELGLTAMQIKPDWPDYTLNTLNDH